MKAYYDYIVAGAGAGGCTVAARLAGDRDARVLLIEAGGPARTPFVTMPAGNGFLFGNPTYDWQLESVPQSGLNGRRVYYPRGKGLGGSTILNGMIYMRGNPADYDGWCRTGLEGWGYANLLPYFLKSQGAVHRNGAYHGVDGPLSTCPAENFNTIDRIFVDAAHQAGAPRNDDFNGPSQIGVGRIDVMVDRGRRQSAARAYLTRQQPNLDVVTGVHVHRVDLDEDRAVGLTLASHDGIRQIRADREIILCLGAFGSPKTLLLSGIGPEDILAEHGLPLRCVLPGVGRNLQDHVNMPVRFGLAQPELSFARYQRLDRAIGLGLQYVMTHKGPGAGPFWGACIFHCLNGDDIPTLQTYFTPMIVQESLTDSDHADTAGLLDRLGRKLLVRGNKTATAGFQLDINLMRPEARGTVSLSSADPRDPPRIDPDYLSSERDVQHLAQAVEVMRDIVRQPAFDGVRGKELSPGPDANLDQAIRSLAVTGHHPVGTCRMGADDDANAVLDSELRVRGINGLRVVDASVFPSQITGNPTAPIVAIAERAADLIAGRTPLPPAHPPAHNGTEQRDGQR